MDRVILTNAPWEKMQPFCLGKPTNTLGKLGDGRLFMEVGF